MSRLVTAGVTASRRRPVLVGVGCVVLALGIALASLEPGSLFTSMTSADVFVFEQLLLPRVLIALLAGASLALSGAVFQSLTRNPLGSPDVLGFTQGAATGALVGVTVLGGATLVVAGSAWIGAVASAALVYLIARRGGVTGGPRLVLVGIGVAAMLGGVNDYLITRANISDAAQAALWITGSLDGSTWSGVVLLAAAAAILMPPLILASRALRIFEMGEDLAVGLGLRTELLRLSALAAAVVLAATAASQTGPVAFVALCAPHVARRLTRASGPNLVPSALVGAVLLVAADWLARYAIPDRELPVGAVTGLLGGGYLAFLLAQQRRTGRI
ncbi:iron chelate uptake ABC transporter family permease subunit [Actinospica durhamensis]|uniref:Iron chelate uptake ABC transporter family permease subunit n=1 Tax=Actinospica durhamensis TaxID=1508375 RepID=A0A941EJ44_9ACTN|nr:iron chelate uptake ABC transporter family permease subunit [Actinospica durhamensis]MBR7831700.1 iron chelate uptake ABC transporter family permease subunit [Actinospica durhamensis]